MNALARIGSRRFCWEDLEVHRSLPIIQIGGGDSDASVSLGGKFDKSEVKTIAGRDNISVGDIRVVGSDMSYEQKQSIERRLTRVFMKELKALCAAQALVVVFDSYEHATTSTSDWAQKHILTQFAMDGHPDY